MMQMGFRLDYDKYSYSVSSSDSEEGKNPQAAGGSQRLMRRIELLLLALTHAQT